jgi:hypothetical protein
MARNAALILDNDHLITTPAIHASITSLNLAAAVHWADTSDLHVDNEDSFPREAEYLTWARVRTAQGRAAPTARQLHDALRYWSGCDGD